jgi:hypothetical protein
VKGEFSLITNFVFLSLSKKKEKKKLHTKKIKQTPDKTKAISEGDDITIDPVERARRLFSASEVECYSL